MIYSISGLLKEIHTEFIVIEAGGVGYQIFISANVINQMPDINQVVTLFTYHHIREDLQVLFGFISLEEKKLFALLTSVSGVGPKVSMKMLSTLTSKQIISAILQGDAPLLTSTPGVGKKVAERLIIELKDKIQKIYTIDTIASESICSSKNLADLKAEASLALNALGYRNDEVNRAFRKAYDDLDVDMSVETCLKILLKHL
jgi:holliday junction DNA helicase RuvA